MILLANRYSLSFDAHEKLAATVNCSHLSIPYINTASVINDDGTPRTTLPIPYVPIFRKLNDLYGSIDVANREQGLGAGDTQACWNFDQSDRERLTQRRQHESFDRYRPVRVVPRAQQTFGARASGGSPGDTGGVVRSITEGYVQGCAGKNPFQAGKGLW